MRTILFRAKRLNNGKWVDGDLIHGQGNKEGKMYILPQTQFYPSGCSDLDGWDVTPETVSQFTGFTDKNGNKIWEGDILEVFSDEVGTPIPSDFIGQVTFTQGGWYVLGNMDMFPLWQEITQWEILQSEK